MGPECFVLRWDEFNTEFISQLQTLRDNEELLDCYLYCDENSMVPAHKVVLASYSPYFRNMLRKMKDNNPVLIMPANVRFEDIVYLVDFMYNGEISIPRDNMDDFLAVAEQFKIRGLYNEQPQRKIPRQIQQYRHGGGVPGPGRQLPPPRPQPAMVPPDIRNRLPPGIVMKSVGGAPMSVGGSPMKRARLDHSLHEEQDDIEEIPGDEEGEEEYYGYDEEFGEPEWDGTSPSTTSPMTTAVPAQQPQQPAAKGPQLMGLLCPHCRTMCHNVQVLKEHISMCPRNTQALQNPGPQPTPQYPAQQPDEVGQFFCHICDKSFKTARTKDNHMKKIHGIEMGGMQSGPAPRVIVPKGKMGRGRRIDPHQQQAVHHQQIMDTGDGWSAGPGTSGGPSSESSIPQSSGKETPRPVGQVAPAQRSATPKSEHDQGPRIGTPEDKRPQPSMRGRGRGMMGPGGMPRHRNIPHPGASAHHSDARPDLLKLGQKFGGSISIGVIDTGNNRPGGKRAPGDGHGVSIQKLKGDVPVGAPMNIRESGPGGPAGKQAQQAAPTASASSSDNQQQSQGNNVVQQNMEEGAGSNVKSEPSSAVKEEPKDFDGDEVGDSHGQDDDFQDFPEEEGYEGEEVGYQDGQYEGSEGEDVGGRQGKYQAYSQVGEEYEQE